MTDSQTCVSLEILATVQSKSKHVVLHKGNIHLEGDFENPSVAVEVGPGDNYPVDLRYKLDQEESWSNWVNFSGLDNISTSKYVRRGELKFSSLLIPDGTLLAATLDFTGTAGANETNATISLTAVVQSTPSLDKSTIKIPTEITAGQSARMSIDAIDTQGIPITEGRGRFIEVAWTGPGGSRPSKKMVFDPGRNRFECEFTGLELSQVGDYHIWLHKVFTYLVLPTQSKLVLPTREHPHRLTVASSHHLSVILGGLVGVVAAACAVLLLFYIKRHPQKVMKVCCHYSSTCDVS